MQKTKREKTEKNVFFILNSLSARLIINENAVNGSSAPPPLSQVTHASVSNTMITCIRFN